jgi:glycosyltransferase involved in cell wall biosynthesis
MLVSIITPSYNQSEYLESTIQSVLSQEYTELEYIIVDGGSTDGSVEVIQKYADQLSWWVSEPDQGQADGINKGLRSAHGDVVAWLNSDDLYLPGAIQSAVTRLQADPEVGMVFGDAITIDQSGHPLNRLSFGDWGLKEMMRFRIVCQPAVFMRRMALEQAGYLDEGFHYMLDHHLWLRIACNSEVKYSGQLWAAARHHPSAKNVALSAGFADETFKALEWMKTAPEFADRFIADQRRIMGGANRLAGRYLLDGGFPGQSLKAYSKALFYWPSYAIKHWGRMMFAFANLFGIGTIENWSRNQPPKMDDPRLSGWPGISLINSSSKT